MPWVSMALCCPHIAASVATQVTTKKFICLSPDTYNTECTSVIVAGCAGKGSFSGCGVSDQWQSALAEIYVQECYISLGEAALGLAGALGLIFIDTRFIVTLQ